jgi:hypothetical protein
VIIIQYYLDEAPETFSGTEATLNAITCFFIWMKGLYFMRIFASFAYLIRMIVNVVIDMKTFLMVLLITLIAFANAFFCLSEANKEPFIEGSLLSGLIFTYRMSLGEWDYGGLGDVAQLLA